MKHEFVESEVPTEPLVDDFLSVQSESIPERESIKFYSSDTSSWLLWGGGNESRAKNEIFIFYVSLSTLQIHWFFVIKS